MAARSSGGARPRPRGEAGSLTAVIKAQTVLRAFPDIAHIADERLRDLTVGFWEEVGRRNPIWEDPEKVPMHPQMLPLERHGSVANHERAMASMAMTLVPVYKREWGIEFDLDHWLVCLLYTSPSPRD